MEVNNLTYSFIRVAGDAEGRGLLGILIGYVATEHGIRARIYDLTTKVPVVVSFEHCKLVPPENILHGLKGLWVSYSDFGHAIIVDERRPRDMLQVRLQKVGTTAVTDWVPLSALTVYGPRPS